MGYFLLISRNLYILEGKSFSSLVNGHAYFYYWVSLFVLADRKLETKIYAQLQ